MDLTFRKKRSIWGNKIIAEEGGRKVGRIFFKIEDSRGFLDTLRVRRNARHKGVGDALVKEAIKTLESKGISDIGAYIHSLNPEAAKRILEKNGFKRDGEKVLVNPFRENASEPNEMKFLQYRRKGGTP